MKRLFSLIAAAAAVFCLQSCNEGLLGGLVDAFAKHYYVGEEVMFVESATYETGELGDAKLMCITLVSKDDPTKTYSLTATEECFGTETKAKDFIVVAQGKESKVSTVGTLVMFDGALKSTIGHDTITGATVEGTITSSGTTSAYTIKSKDFYVTVPDKDGQEIKIDMNFCYIGKLDVK